MKLSPIVSNRLFVICVAISVVSLATSLRIITGTGFGVPTRTSMSSGEMLSSGFLFNPADNLSYVSWAEQARKDSYFVSDMFTTDDHSPLLFNPYFVLMGKASYALGASVTTMLIVSGMIGAAITLFACFHISRSLGFSTAAARWGTVFVAFASGFSPFVFALNYFFKTKLPMGVDVIHQDAILFSTFFAYPYHTASVALMVMVIYCIVRCEQRKGASNSHTFVLLLFLPVVAFLTHPYEMVMLLSSYSLFVLTMPVGGHTTWLRRWHILLLITISMTPAVVYQWWLSQQPVWNNFVMNSLCIQKPRLSWLIGYGTTLPLAIVGAYYCWRNRRYSRGLWFVVWVCLLIVLLAIFAFPAKVCSGGHFPMCVLAGLGFSKILARAGQVRNIYLRTVGLLAVSLALLASFATSIDLLLRVYRPYKYDASIGEVLTAINERSISALTTPRVLCNTEVGLLAPALAGVRVFAGHWALTPGYHFKRTILAAAGVESVDGVSSSNCGGRHVFCDLIQRHRFDYVVLDDKSGAQSFVLDSGNLTLIGVYGLFSLYKVSHERMAGRD